jgi:TPR repeat protein
MNPDLEAAARLYDQAAEELDRAAAHCRVSARHFRGGVVPRGAAHAWAALGHIRKAEARLDEQAQTHAERSSID